MKNTTYKLQAMIHDYWHDGVEYHVYYDLLDKVEADMLLEAAMEISDEVESILTTADSITKPVIAVAKGEKAIIELQLRECPYTNEVEANLIGVYQYEVPLPSLSPREIRNRL